MAAISQTTFSNAFSWMKMFEFWLCIHWVFFPKGSINIIPALVQIMAWRRSDDKPLTEPMVVSLLMHIWVTRPEWVNEVYTLSNKVNIVPDDALAIQGIIRLYTDWKMTSFTNHLYGWISATCVILTHCGLVTPYGDIDLGQHWHR